MKKTLFAIALTALSSSVLAEEEQNYYIEGGLTHISVNNINGDEDFGQAGVSGAFGYNFNPNDDFQNKLELLFGFGIGSDDVSNISTKLKNYYGLSYRPTVKFENGLELFGKVVVARAKAEASASYYSYYGGRQNFTVSESDTETGFGVGVSYNSFSLYFMELDDTRFFTASYTYQF